MRSRVDAFLLGGVKMKHDIVTVSLSILGATICIVGGNIQNDDEMRGIAVLFIAFILAYIVGGVRNYVVRNKQLHRRDVSRIPTATIKRRDTIRRSTRHRRF